MVTRWQLHDPVAAEDYTFPINPASMTPIERGRILSVEPTALSVGSNLYWEGNIPPREWSFEGKVRTFVQYEALLGWVTRKHRIRVTDHYGRQFWVLWRDWRFTPRERWLPSKPWTHGYQVDAYVVTDPTAATEHLDL